MATTTTNLGLTKPSYSDTADIAVINTNMDTLDTAVNATEAGLAIISNNNSHSAITKGQYVYVRKHGTLPEGLYKATANIATNGTLSSSNVAAVSYGLGGEIATISDQIAKRSISEVVNVSGTTSASGIIEINIANIYTYAFCVTNVSKSLDTPYSVTVDNWNNLTSKMNLRIRNMGDNSAVGNTSVAFEVMIIGINT